MGLVLRPHTHSCRAHDERVAHPRYLTERPVAGRGRAPKPRRPSPWRETPPLAPSCHPCGALGPAGHASQGASARSPRLHTRTHSMGAASPDCLPQAQAVKRGRAPNEGRGRPAPGSPPAIPTAHNASS